jgi:hypothetical protein
MQPSNADQAGYVDHIADAVFFVHATNIAGPDFFGPCQTVFTGFFI